MFNASEDAEDAFYAAFSAGALEDMMQVWAPQDDIVCIHPGGPRLMGLREIRQSWAQILSGALPRSFALRGRIVSGDASQRIHLLEENISVPGTAFIDTGHQHLPTIVRRLAAGDAPRQRGPEQRESGRARHSGPR